MKNNLLFINQNREIIRKFLEAMKEYSLDIDTASTADQVVAVFKKKKYGNYRHGSAWFQWF